MSNRRLSVALIIILILVGICLVCFIAGVSVYLLTGERGAGGFTTGEFAGFYTNGFEVSSFVPCSEVGPAASGEAWWLGADPGVGFYDQYSALVEGANPPLGDYATVYVRFRGTVSPAGEYGHLGAYAREASVTEVLEMSIEGSC